MLAVTPYPMVEISSRGHNQLGPLDVPTDLQYIAERMTTCKVRSSVTYVSADLSFWNRAVSPLACPNSCGRSRAKDKTRLGQAWIAHGRNETLNSIEDNTVTIDCRRFIFMYRMHDSTSPNYKKNRRLYRMARFRSGAACGHY